MKSLFTRLGLGTVLAATALGAISTPAAARPYYRDGGNDAAIAIGAGILGLAVGAAIADRDDDRYYDRGYYGERRYVTVRDRPGYYYYYANRPNYYYQDRYYDRYYAPYYRERWGRGDWSRSHWGRDRDWRHDRWEDRHDRWHDRHDRRDWRH